MNQLTVKDFASLLDYLEVLAKQQKKLGGGGACEGWGVCWCGGKRRDAASTVATATAASELAGSSPAGASTGMLEGEKRGVWDHGFHG
jgi:hypothetical protein